jgi:putative ABC transport system ATP-binding protein
VIALKDIYKTYQVGESEVHALDGVSLTVEDGEFVAIIGPSGSGKSTLMNIIGCLDLPDSGEYQLDDLNVTALSERKIAKARGRKIGFIFQGFNLLPKLNALDNVELPLIYQNMSPGRRKQAAMSALERVGLKGRSRHKPDELSGGEQQRVAVARALAGQPSVILADEPTGNLDSKTGEEIMRLFHEMHEAGNTIVLITHDPNVAAQAQRRVRMQDGKLSEEGA